MGPHHHQEHDQQQVRARRRRRRRRWQQLPAHVLPMLFSSMLMMTGIIGNPHLAAPCALSTILLLPVACLFATAATATAAAAAVLDFDSNEDGALTYAEYDETLERINNQIHFPNSPQDDFSQCDGVYPRSFAEYVYLTFYNVDETLATASPDEYDQFLTIFKKVMNDCAADDCINVEEVYLVEDVVDTFDHAAFVNGVGWRRLLEVQGEGEEGETEEEVVVVEDRRHLQQNRKRKRGKRNVKKIKVKGRNYSRRNGRLLLRDKSKDRARDRRGRSLQEGQEEEEEERELGRQLQEGTGTCGDMLLSRLRRADLTAFDCLASVEVTAYDLRCLDERLLAAAVDGPIDVQIQLVGGDEGSLPPLSPGRLPRGRENEGPSLLSGQGRPNIALPYNPLDRREEPSVSHLSNNDRDSRPQLLPGQPDGAGDDGDWVEGAVYIHSNQSPNN